MSSESRRQLGSPLEPGTLERLLSVSPVFRTLTRADRCEVAARAVPRAFEKGEVAAAQGEVWTGVLLVAEGSIRLVKASEGGRVLAAATLGPGEVFFGHSLFDGEPLPATLEAEGPCRVFAWDGATVLRLVRGNPGALWELAENMARQMRRAAGVIDTLAFQPLPRRLARLLLDRFVPGRGEAAPRTMTLDEMAARIGTTREVVCRLLYRFADEGLIDITRTEFNLRDRDRLAEMAGED